MNSLQKHIVVIVAGFVFGSFLGLDGHNSNVRGVGNDFEPTKLLVNSSAFLAISSVQTPEVVKETIRVVVTGYSSSFWQTDDTPFITAAGTLVREGIVAANFLPIGTKIKLPDLYGEQVFVVEDRMHPRKNYQVDIWFPSYSEALNFGAKRTYIYVLES